MLIVGIAFAVVFLFRDMQILAVNRNHIGISMLLNAQTDKSVSLTAGHAMLNRI